MPSAKRKTHHRDHRKTGRTRPTSQSNQAIVQIAAPPEKPWQLDQKEITIVKNSICKGASDQELEYCLTVARRYKLDPFKGQIWFIKRWDKNADNGKGGTGAYIWVAQVAVYGMLHIAARDHKDFGSVSKPEYGPIVEVIIEGGKLKGPEWARVEVFKKGMAEPTIGEVFFEEYCPKKWENTLFWRQMPRRMLSKCAIAQAIRQAYPDTGGLYIPEEMSRMKDDFTENGRQIVNQDGFSPSGEPITDSAHNTSHAGAIAAEVERQKEESAGASKQPFSGSIEIDASHEGTPIVRWSSDVVGEVVKSKCKLVWGKDEFWHIGSGTDLGTIKDICDKMNLECIEILPAKAVRPTSENNSAGKDRRPDNKSATKAGKKDKDSSGRVESAVSSRSRLVSDTYIKTTELKTTPNTKVPYMVLLVKAGPRAVWMSTFNQKFFDWFIKAKEHSVDCELLIEDTDKHGPNVVGIKRIGNVEFDGKNPIPKDKPENPSGSLFNK